MAGDGNCFFHVIALQLRAAGVTEEGVEYNHLRLRELAVNYINDHREEFIPLLQAIAIDHFPHGIHTTSENYIARLQLYENILNGDINAYLAEMRQNHIWADHLMIQALANAANLEILIHHMNRPIETITPNAVHTQAATLIIALYTGAHYLALTSTTTSSSAITENDQVPTPGADTEYTHPINNSSTSNSAELQTIATEVVDTIILGVIAGLFTSEPHDS